MKILYLCTHNRCRSILAEAISNHLSNGAIEAKSAGSSPAGEIFPKTLTSLKAHGIDTAGLKSQSWNDFEDFAPHIIMTLCDSAANESCPVWMLGNRGGASSNANNKDYEPIKVHWPLSDPSKVLGSESDIDLAFNQTIAEIKQRILLMLNSQIISLPQAEKARLLQQWIKQ